MDEDVFPKPPEPATTMPMYDKTLAEVNQLGSVGISALPHRPTITELLQHKRNQLVKELELVDKALEQMRIQKDTAILLDAIAQAHVRQDY